MNAIPKILVVDDSPKLLEDALPMYGYSVCVATDGLLALKALKENDDIDLVILDIVMPNLDGWATLKAIRNNEKTAKMPIIMLTSENDANKQISGLKFGADDYIVKPYVLPNLLARIESVLRRSNWNKEEINASALSFVTGEKISPLTQREKEILTLVAEGNSNSKIAEKLFVREVTIKTHLNSVYRKLNVDNRVQAVLLAQQTQLI